VDSADGWALVSADERAAPPALLLSHVAKSFGAVVALRDGTLTLESGSIHALVGENGAGKSTIVKIIAGLYQRDSGEMELRGESVDFKNTAEAKAAGIAVIYQEPTLFPDLSVTENIFMGRQPTKSLRRIDRATMRRSALDLFARLGVNIDPDRPARGLSIADQQIIEIAKAISLDARVLIMDEPTAALSGVEVERLFTIARALRDEGRAIAFISHRFDEIFSLCDTITVMRDGDFISTGPIADTTVEKVVRQMVGRDIGALFPKEEAKIGAPVLEVQGLTEPGVFDDITFTVRAGEIVALAGLVGAGRSEVVRAVFGVDPYKTGTVKVDGKLIPRRNPAASMRMGVGLVPEDRRSQGLVMGFSVSWNTTLAIRNRLSKAGILAAPIENPVAARWASALQVKTAALSTEVGTLSGGNQQKVVMAKWLASSPKVLIVDEPTRGIDVGTKSDIHRLLSQLAGEGLAVLMISSELPEVLGMADRVLVMREGRITADIPRDKATSETVMFAATHGAEVSA
jgi:rhamnose transport system ATP-binding protein